MTPAYTLPSSETPPYNKKSAYEPRKSDIVFAAVMLILGFLFWECLTPRGVRTVTRDAVIYEDIPPGFGVTLFFLLALAVCATYMYMNGCRQNAKSAVALASATLGALPFFLFDALPINIFLLLFEMLVCLIWVCFTCRTEIVKKFGGFAFFDAINQAFVVPFANFGALPASIGQFFKKHSGGKRLLFAAIGVIVSVPLIIGVLSLLAQADDSFSNLLDKAAEIVKPETLWSYAWKVLLGIPVAMYIFALASGNTAKRRTDFIKEGHAHNFVDKAHRIPATAVYAPLIILCVIYLVFIAAMAGYLTSAFASDLPADFTYAEYARRGFFELCAVAAINLCALAFAWMFGKRGASKHPKPLRVIGGLMSTLTLLLIAAAASKMIMYVDVYGLSRLRLYTLWAMLALVCVFVALLIWHIRPKGAGKPIILVCVALFLGLYFANTDGIIAKHNVKNYLDGNLKTVDTKMLADMSDATVPWLDELCKNASDSEVRLDAENVLKAKLDREKNFNLQSKMATSSVAIRVPRFSS
jgi:hypothetical protein